MAGQLTADRSEHRPVGGSSAVGTEYSRLFYGVIMLRILESRKRHYLVWCSMQIKRRLGGVRLE